MKFEFEINDKYLLIHALNDKQPAPFKEWEGFRQRSIKKYPLAKKIFMHNSISGTVFLEIVNLEYFLNNAKNQTIKLTKEGLKSKPFKKLKKETEEYLRFVKNQWESNSEFALKELSKITGLNLKSSNKKIKVYITHPKMKNGINLPHLNSICWGHPEDWKNYTIVYLCHELLHLVTKNKEKNGLVMHAIIELACDNELRIRLNKKGRYFKENKEEIGHPFLRSLEKKMLPEWKKFLKDKKSDIFKFEQKILKDLKK